MPNPLAPPVKRIVVLFVKAPLVGDVKTRLLPTFSAGESADLYKQFVRDTISNVSKCLFGGRLVVAYQAHSKYPDLEWLKLKKVPGFIKQEGGNIRDRLIHSFGFHFGKGYQQVVVIGSDTPNLSPEYVDQAFGMLNTSDVVLGPNLTGGYCLVGLSRPCLKLFDDVIWSSDQIYERTAQNVHTQNYRLKVLPQHYSVDTVEDIRVLQMDLEREPSRARLTHNFLQQIAKQKTLFPVA